MSEKIQDIDIIEGETQDVVLDGVRGQAECSVIPAGSATVSVTATSFSPGASDVEVLVPGMTYTYTAIPTAGWRVKGWGYKYTNTTWIWCWDGSGSEGPVESSDASCATLTDYDWKVPNYFGEDLWRRQGSRGDSCSVEMEQINYSSQAYFYYDRLEDKEASTETETKYIDIGTLTSSTGTIKGTSGLEYIDFGESLHYGDTISGSIENFNTKYYIFKGWYKYDSSSENPQWEKITDGYSFSLQYQPESPYVEYPYSGGSKITVKAEAEVRKVTVRFHDNTTYNPLVKGYMVVDHSSTTGDLEYDKDYEFNANSELYFSLWNSHYASTSVTGPKNPVLKEEKKNFKKYWIQSLNSDHEGTYNFSMTGKERPSIDVVVKPSNAGTASIIEKKDYEEESDAVIGYGYQVKFISADEEKWPPNNVIWEIELTECEGINKEETTKTVMVTGNPYPKSWDKFTYTGTFDDDWSGGISYRYSYVKKITAKLKTELLMYDPQNGDKLLYKTT